MPTLLIGRIENNGLVVVTNCADHDVPVGTRFQEIIKQKVTLALPEVQRFDLGTIAAVDLTIQEITLKPGGASIEAIPRGWSAALRLVGRNVEAVHHALQGAINDEQVLLR